MDSHLLGSLLSNVCFGCVYCSSSSVIISLAVSVTRIERMYSNFLVDINSYIYRYGSQFLLK